MQVNKTKYVQIHMIKCLSNSLRPWFGVTLMQKLLQKIPYFANWLILHWFLSVLCVGELPRDKRMSILYFFCCSLCQKVC